MMKQIQYLKRDPHFLSDAFQADVRYRWPTRYTALVQYYAYPFYSTSRV